jgi:hypothetical protein
VNQLKWRWLAPAVLLASALTTAACRRRLPRAAETAATMRTTLATGREGIGSSPDGSIAGTLLACVMTIARQSRAGSLPPTEAARLCGGSVSASEVPTSWIVNTPFDRLVVIANDAAAPEHSAAEYVLTVRVEAGVVLTDLAAALGPYRKTFESKTSSASFIDAQSGSVFADLLSSKVLPSAPVIRVVRGHPSHHHHGEQRSVGYHIHHSTTSRRRYA